jgi:branched-chain amino acid transport system permease protein
MKMKLISEIINIDRYPKLKISLILLFLIILPFFIPNQYYIHILVLSGIYVIMALGLNIVVGFAGLLVLGYIAFYAVGAYLTALLSVNYHISFWILLPLAGVLAAIFGILLGIPTLRVRGIYLAIVTLGFGEIIRLVLRNWDSLTNGPKGIMGILHPKFLNFKLTTPFHFYYLILILVILIILITYRLSRSPIGKFWIAIKDDEIAALSLGINTVRMKLLAFAIGAFFAGLAGCFFASWQGFVAPRSFTFLESIIVLSIVIIGGMGNILGSIISALIIVILPEILREFQQFRMLFFGVALILIMIYRNKRKVRYKKEHILEKKSLKIEKEETILKEIPSLNRERIILEVFGVEKSFGGLKALSEVSFKVKELEILSIIGPNGAGKTTFFNCLSGIEMVDKGEIYFYKEKIVSKKGSLPTYKIAQKGISRTFQNTRLFKSLKVIENLLIGIYACQGKRSEGEEMKKAFQILDYVGLKDYYLEEVENLSFGHQRYLEIAQALATSPKLLLLDEPANGLNPHEREELLDLLLRIRNELKIAILLIEHNMKLVMNISDNILVLDHGEQIAYGTPDQILEDRVVQEAYLGRGLEIG